MSAAKDSHGAPMYRLVPAIFLSSLGSVLFSLLIFRLLSFFIMPSMFFSLLLVGFPIGAALAARRTDCQSVQRFRFFLAVLEGVMLLSIVATLLGKHVNYLRAHFLFGVDPTQLLMQVLIFALIYLPFFIAYGAAEYAGYLTGTRTFGQRMRPVYGLFLLGGAAAFALAECLQRPLGVPRLLLVAIAMVALGRFCLLERLPWRSKDRQSVPAGAPDGQTGVAPAAIPAGRDWKAILRSGPELALLVGLICWPALDGTFMRAFKSSANVPLSAAAYLKEEPGGSVVFSGWGKYSYLEILQLPLAPNPLQMKNSYAGLYNDVQVWWYYPLAAPLSQLLDKGLTPSQLPPQMQLGERVPFLFFPGKPARAAIVGSGGGRHVAPARSAGYDRIVATEIEPAVVDALQGSLREEFDSVYNQDDVEVCVGEARGYFERTQERFHLIMLISVGGYPQLMLEPGNMIHTSEAFRLFSDRLTPDGLLVVGYPSLIDKEAVLLRQYTHTLRHLGMETHVYVSPSEYFLLLANRPDASAEQKSKWAQARRQLARHAKELSDSELYLRDFRPLTDDRPYLAGNVRYVLSEGQIWEMVLVLSVLIGAITLLLALYLPDGLRRQHCPVRPAAVLGMAFLVGVNFMLIEQLCVIQIFRHLYSYYDALIIGIVAFLTLTGLGSLLAPKSKFAPLLAFTLVLALVWWCAPAEWGLAATVALFLPVVLATGTLFPMIFEQVPTGRFAFFAMDAIGAAVGGLVSFFVPMIFGLRALTGVAMATFLVTGLGTLLFLNRANNPRALPSEFPAGS
jgi:spermidine synthase